jgi:hypothetical protein
VQKVDIKTDCDMEHQVFLGGQILGIKEEGVGTATVVVFLTGLVIIEQVLAGTIKACKGFKMMGLAGTRSKEHI